MDYAKDHRILDPNDPVMIASIQKEVKDGDLTVIMRPYEESIKTPLRSLVSGDMIRLMLIQIQKTKTDAAIAMQALDKLLRSNELNFAFLAVVPTFLVLGTVFRWMQSQYERQRSLTSRSTSVLLKRSLREIERCLNVNTVVPEVEGEISFVMEGHVLVEVALLQGLSDILPVALRTPWRQDLSDLSGSSFNLAQRQRVLDRMYRFYDFLGAKE